MKVVTMCAVLTVLLVEPPQLDLVGFMLGLLLQPAGPETEENKTQLTTGTANSVRGFPFITLSHY